MQEFYLRYSHSLIPIENWLINTVPQFSLCLSERLGNFGKKSYSFVDMVMPSSVIVWAYHISIKFS